jgi:hypothetical protein
VGHGYGQGEAGQHVGEPVVAQICAGHGHHDRRGQPQPGPRRPGQPRGEKQPDHGVPDDRVDGVARREGNPARLAEQPYRYVIRQWGVRRRPVQENLERLDNPADEQERGHGRRERPPGSAPQPDRRGESQADRGQYAAGPEAVEILGDQVSRVRPVRVDQVADGEVEIAYRGEAECANEAHEGSDHGDIQPPTPPPIASPV